MQTKTIIYVGAGVAGVALAIWLLKSASKAATAAKAALGKAAEAVNPASPNNLAYQAASALTPQGSVGSYLYDLFNTGAPKADAPTRATPKMPSIDLGAYPNRDDEGNPMPAFGLGILPGDTRQPLTIEIIGSSKDMNDA